MSSRQTRPRKQAGIKFSATQTINWTVPPDQISLSQPLSPKNHHGITHRRNNHNNNNNNNNNSRHGYSNTQPLQNVIANINFTDPQSPRYKRGDGQIEVSTNKHKHKPLPSRPLTPNNQTKRKMFHIPSITTRRRQKHTASDPLGNWQTKYSALQEKYNKLLSDKNELQQKHGGLSRSYKELQTKYRDKCAECDHLLQEKKELNRNLDAIRRRDSIAKSHKSDVDNISLSGDFSDNKSEYSAIGIAAVKHQLIASPSQSALYSIPPYQPNNHQSIIYNKMTNKIQSKYNNNNNNNNNNTPNSNPSNNGIFSDDGNESETSSNIGVNQNRYNKIIGYQTNNNNPTRYTINRVPNGSYSSMESDNTNNTAFISPNGSQRFNIIKKPNSYKSLDHYDEENPDPYARVDLI